MFESVKKFVTHDSRVDAELDGINAKVLRLQQIGADELNRSLDLRERAQELLDSAVKAERESERAFSAARKISELLA